MEVIMSVSVVYGCNSHTQQTWKQCSPKSSHREWLCREKDDEKKLRTWKHPSRTLFWQKNVRNWRKVNPFCREEQKEKIRVLSLYDEDFVIPSTWDFSKTSWSSAWRVKQTGSSMKSKNPCVNRNISRHQTREETGLRARFLFRTAISSSLWTFVW
jgi:hypothetical protein